MNTEELLNLEPLAVPWYDNINEFEIEEPQPNEDVDEFALEIEAEIANAEDTLNSVDFKEGEMIRNNPTIKVVLAKPQKQPAMPWE